MGNTRLFSQDPITRSKEVFHYDPVEDDFYIENIQDTTPVLEENKRQLNAGNGRYGEKLIHKVASIPLSVWQDLVRRGIANDEKALRRWLDDRDNSVFKVHPGKLSR